MDVGSILTGLARDGEPPLIAQLSRAAWLAGVAQTAVRVDLFTKLKGKKLNAAEIADLMGSDPRYTGGLLNSCVSIGLLEKTGDQYQNTHESDTYLVKGEPLYYGDSFTYQTGLWPLLDSLDTAVLTGEAISHEHESESEEEKAAYWRHYMMAMHQWGLTGHQQMLVKNTDLTGRRRMLDVAAGSGVYSMAFCREYPELTSVMFDQEKALPLAKSLIEAEGMSSRISTLAGDYYTDSLGSGYDVVLFSGVLCQESIEWQRKLMRQAYEGMDSGGLVIVHDVMKMAPYNTETSPLTAIMSFIISIAYGRSAGVGTGDDTVESLTSVGFITPVQTPLPGVFSLITALKP